MTNVPFKPLTLEDIQKLAPELGELESVAMFHAQEKDRLYQQERINAEYSKLEDWENAHLTKLDAVQFLINGGEHMLSALWSMGLIRGSPMTREWPSPLEQYLWQRDAAKHTEEDDVPF